MKTSWPIHWPKPSPDTLFLAHGWTIDGFGWQGTIFSHPNSPKRFVAYPRTIELWSGASREYQDANGHVLMES